MKNNWRVRNRPMYEIAPLSPIVATRGGACYGTFTPASALSHPLRHFWARSWKRTLVPICRYKKYKNRSRCLEPAQKLSKRKKREIKERTAANFPKRIQKKRKVKDANLFEKKDKNKPKRFKRISKTKNC